MPSGFATPPGQDLVAEPIALRHAAGRISAVELGIVLACGAAGALVVALVHMKLRVPGHAILKGMLPLTLGLALVPRPLAGSWSALGALFAAAILLFAGWGEVQASALTGLVLLGPTLDLAERGDHSRAKFVARAAVAGLLANLAALGVKLIAAPLGWESGGGRGFAAVWPMGIFTFALCGILAGALSATIRLATAARGDGSKAP